MKSTSVVCRYKRYALVTTLNSTIRYKKHCFQIFFAVRVNTIRNTFALLDYCFIQHVAARQKNTMKFEKSLDVLSEMKTSRLRWPSLVLTPRSWTYSLSAVLEDTVVFVQDGRRGVEGAGGLLILQQLAVSLRYAHLRTNKHLEYLLPTAFYNQDTV
jgi:hypothetical protein